MALFISVTMDPSWLSSLSCDICQQGFTNQCNLVRHQTTVHAYHSWSCPQCGPTFSRQDALIRHTKSCRKRWQDQSDDNTPLAKQRPEWHECPECGRTFEQAISLERHQVQIHQPTWCTTCGEQFLGTCEGTVIHKFPGGVYRPAPSLFEQLEEQGIVVPDHLKYFPYWVMYDIEAMLVPQQDQNNTDKLEWTGKHIPASVSICLNVPSLRSSCVWSVTVIDSHDLGAMNDGTPWKHQCSGWG